MEDSGYVAVRAKRALPSNDQRQLTVLEGTMGALIAVEGSGDRPRFRVVFATAVKLGRDAQPEAARRWASGGALTRDEFRAMAEAGECCGNGSRGGGDVRPVRVQPWAELVVGVNDVVLDPVLDVVAEKHRPPNWPPSLLSVKPDDAGRD